MFDWLKSYFMLSAALLWIGCTPVGPTGKTAASMPGEADQSSGSAQPVDLSMDIGQYGTLQVSGGLLTAGVEGQLTLVFTAKQALRSYETDHDNDVNGNEEVRTTLWPTLRLTFGEAETSCDDSCRTRAGSFLHYLSKSGSYMQMKDMNPGDSITIYLKVTAQDSFTLTPRLIGDGIDETGDGEEITVHPNEDEEEGDEQPKPRGTWQHKLTRADRTYNLSAGGAVTSVNPWKEYDEVTVYKGHRPFGDLLLDYDDLYYHGQPENGKLRVTFFKRESLGDGAYFAVNFSDKLEVYNHNIVSNSDGAVLFYNKLGNTFRYTVSNSMGTLSNFVIEFELKPNQDSKIYPVWVSMMGKGAGSKRGKVAQKDLPGGRKPKVRTMEIKNSSNKKFFDATFKVMGGSSNTTTVHAYFKASRDTTDENILGGEDNDLSIFFDDDTAFNFQLSKSKIIRNGQHVHGENGLKKFLKKYQREKDKGKFGKPYLHSIVKGDMKKGDTFMFVFKLTSLNTERSNHTVQMRYDPVDFDAIESEELYLTLPRYTPFNPPD